MRILIYKFVLFFFLFPVLETAGKSILFKELSYNFNNIKVDSALNFIEKDIDYYFIYNAELVEKRPNISANFVNFPLSVILDSLFNDPTLDYKILDKQVVIYKNRNTKLSQAQKTPDPKHKTISGFIVDKNDNTPLPFSTIRVYNKGVGTVSNLDGEFRFKIQQAYFADSIEFSHLGYEPLLIDLATADTIKLFKLQAKSISLQEILIRWQDPKELLVKALKAARNNYPANPSQLRAFYRESLQRNNKYMLYIEGLLDVYKSAYRPTLFRDQAKLLQLRRFTNIESTDTVLFKLQGGIDASVALDLLREPLDFIKPGELHAYNYSYEGIEAINEMDAHKISFIPNSNNEDNDYTGTIHIDTKSLAIVKIQFSLINRSARKSAYNYVLKSKPNIKVIPRLISYDINYKKIGDKHYINHIFCNMNLKVKRKRKLLASNYKIRFEMITTDVTTTDIEKFKRRERLKPRLILTDLRKSYLEDLNEYWGSNNFILPENDLIKALEKFKIEELRYSDEK